MEHPAPLRPLRPLPGPIPTSEAWPGPGPIPESSGASAAASACFNGSSPPRAAMTAGCSNTTPADGNDLLDTNVSSGVTWQARYPVCKLTLSQCRLVRPQLHLYTTSVSSVWLYRGLIWHLPSQTGSCTRVLLSVPAVVCVGSWAMPALFLGDAGLVLESPQNTCSWYRQAHLCTNAPLHGVVGGMSIPHAHLLTALQTGKQLTVSRDRHGQTCIRWPPAEDICCPQLMPD